MPSSRRSYADPSRTTVSPPVSSRAALGSSSSGGNSTVDPRSAQRTVPSANPAVTIEPSSLAVAHVGAGSRAAPSSTRAPPSTRRTE